MSPADRYVALAMANAAWYLGAFDEPLTPGHPAADKDSTSAWDAETAEYRRQCEEYLVQCGDRAVQEAALSELRASAAARRHAARHIRRRYGASVLPLPIRVFGPGWRAHPHVLLGDERAPRALTREASVAAEAADRARIEAAITAARGNVGRAAEALAVNRRQLDRRITALGLRPWLSATYPRAVRQPQKNSMAGGVGAGKRPSLPARHRGASRAR